MPYDIIVDVTVTAAVEKGAQMDIGVVAQAESARLLWVMKTGPDMFLDEFGKVCHGSPTPFLHLRSCCICQEIFVQFGNLVLVG